MLLEFLKELMMKSYIVTCFSWYKLLGLSALINLAFLISLFNDVGFFSSVGDFPIVFCNSIMVMIDISATFCSLAQY